MKRIGRKMDKRYNENDIVRFMQLCTEENTSGALYDAWYFIERFRDRNGSIEKIGNISSGKYLLRDDDVRHIQHMIKNPAK